MTQQKPKPKVRIVCDKINLKNPVLLEGFQGVGLVGTLAAQYIAKILKADLVGYIESPLLPPLAIMDKGRLMRPIRIYSIKSKNLLIVESELPIPQALSHLIANEIVKWCKKVGVKKIVCLEGLAVPKPPEDGKVFAVTNNIKSNKFFEDNKIEVLTDGLIIGISAAIMLESRSKSLTTDCLMAESHMNFPDGNAAANIIEVLNKLYKIDVDPAPLIKEAKQFEDKLKDVIQKVIELKKTQSGKRPTIYG